MASGITHILLMKNIQGYIKDEKFQKILQSGRDFLQVGAVGPDLPYASIADNDFFLTTQSELADKFHYEKTNELILKAFKRIKEEWNTMTERERRFIFCFFLGFASHIVADGIIHPFVRDKVGNYKDNQTAHRVLEMQLDVLLFYHLTIGTGEGINLNYSNIHDELKNFDRNIYAEVNRVLKIFNELIYEVYKYQCKPSDIEGWVKGLHRMFGVAEGKHPKIYRIIEFIDNFLFKDYEDLRDKYEQILVLEKPKDRDENFLKRDRIHFFDNCVPKFYEVFIPIANKCYDYIYNNKGELEDIKIPPIDLDTGRDLAANNLDVTPTLWSLA
ncbi:MAG: zinc dependent phospholipase C family protein [Ignavibacteriales bacterium]|nr:zinc dependent phospholipase C family protein [Ignavibacteriales bacterium]